MDSSENKDEDEEVEDEAPALTELPDIVDYSTKEDEMDEERQEEEEQEKFISIFDILDAPRELPEPEPMTQEKLRQTMHQLGLIKFCWSKIEEPNFEDRVHFPDNYLENTDKEKLLLYYTENFRLQFKKLYPNRKELFLAADNEVGLQKMVCTTIRATSLPYPEIQSWKEIAKFVGEYVDYEQLENPIQIVSNRLYKCITF